jgi:coenzyme F420-0:L-glutamate ligase/coenzyme F420-1:gamma-L-glutamate ligase
VNDIQLSGLHDIPDVMRGDNIADIVSNRAQLQDGDVLVVAAKIVAVAEGQAVPLAQDDAAERRSLIDGQSTRLLRKRDDQIITETAYGFVCVDAGIDWSSIEGHAVLLPREPDRSAFKIRERLRATAGIEVGVIVSSRFDRPWRNGAVGVALGCTGISPVLNGVCIVDELAAAASLVMGSGRRVPVVVIRGLAAQNFDITLAGVRTDVLTKPADDLFR